MYNRFMEKDRVAIYIDGSNFYHYLKGSGVALGTGARFDYRKFVELVTGDRECVTQLYYTGIFRNVDGTETSERLVCGQQKFLAKLQNDGFVIKRGRIMYDKGKPREKGTDVKISLDMAMGAVDDLYDTAIIVSSDTDLIPALDLVSSRGRRVEYVGFSNAPSFGMQKNADISRLLTPEDIRKLTI
jgi:uncharacterized LabA/DUF88 family protein